MTLRNFICRKGHFENEAIHFIGCELPEFPLSCKFLQENITALMQQKHKIADCCKQTERVHISTEG